MLKDSSKKHVIYLWKTIIVVGSGKGCDIVVGTDHPTRVACLSIESKPYGCEIATLWSTTGYELTIANSLRCLSPLPCC